VAESISGNRRPPPAPGTRREWETRMAAAFGAKPTVTYYDNHVVVDNEAGKVTVDG
jgi:hypothetical protein